jgi:PleD family two-component response regulator
LQIAIRGGNLSLTASFGCCKLEPGDDLRTAMVNADAAVYQAKKDGRNLVREAAQTVATAEQTKVA